MKKNSWYQTLYLFLLLYFCYDSNVVIFRLPNTTIFISLAVTILFSIISILKNKFRINSKSLLVVSFFMIFTLISGVLYGTNFNNLIYFLLIYIIAFIVSCTFSKDEFIYSFIITVFISCIFGILTEYIMFPLYKAGIINGAQYFIKKSYWPRVDLFFGFSIITLNNAHRMYSFFREPGVFQIFILIALSFLLFNSGKIEYKKIIMGVLVFCLLMTFSTSGYIFGMFILMSWMFSDSSKVKLKNNKILSIFIILILTYLLFGLIQNNSILLYNFSKMLEKLTLNTESESFSVRFYSVFNVLKASLINPVIGIGWDYGLNYIINNYNQFGTRDVTGTTLIILTVYGYPMGVLCNYYLYKTIKYFHSKNNYLAFILNFIAIFLSINTQNILQNVFVWLIILFPLFFERDKYEK